MPCRVFSYVLICVKPHGSAFLSPSRSGCIDYFRSYIMFSLAVDFYVFKCYNILKKIIRLKGRRDKEALSLYEVTI